MNHSPCAYIKAPSSYYIVLREGWVFLLQLRWAHQRCRGRRISWGIKVFSSSYREEERVLSCSKGSHRAELTGRKWKQERLTSITGRKRVKGVEDSSTHSFPQGIDPHGSGTGTTKHSSAWIWNRACWGMNERGLARQRPPCCLHAKGKLKLILEENLVTVVVCSGVDCGNQASLKQVTAQSRVCDWIGLFLQWRMTPLVPECLGSFLLQFENFLPWTDANMTQAIFPVL